MHEEVEKRMARGLPAFLGRVDLETEDAVRQVAGVLQRHRRLAREEVGEEQPRVHAIQRRTRTDHHPVDALFRAVHPESLEQHRLHEAPGTLLRHREARRLGERAAREVRRQRGRGFDGERAEAVGLDAHRAERLAVEARLGEQHHATGGGVVRLGRAQQFGEARHVAAIGAIAHRHRLLQPLVVRHGADRERQPLDPIGHPGRHNELGGHSRPQRFHRQTRVHGFIPRLRKRDPVAAGIAAIFTKCIPRTDWTTECQRMQ